MRTRRSLSHVIAALAALALALVGCTDDRPSGAPSATPPQGSQPIGTAPPSGTPPSTPAGTPTGPLDLQRIAITLEPFVTVPGGPLAIAAPDDGTGRLFVVSQNGRIWVVDADGRVLDDPLVNLDDRVQSGGEQGLLGLALHPDFPTDPRVFIDYTDNNGDTVIASLEIDPNDPNRIDPGTERQILFIEDPYGNHNGGAMLFGPDGYLYVSQGDGGGGGDPQENGQNPNALLAKVLRLDIDGAKGDLGYESPPDNPFVGKAGADEVWLMGLRNPWRMSFDRATGDLWIGDVGQGAFEEIDIAPAGEGGLNFGWNRMEGNHCYPPGSECRTEGLTRPVSEYGRELGYTVIGGYVYRGAAYPALNGAYLFADYGSGIIFAIDSATRELVEPVQVGSTGGSISAFGEDATGELYVTTLQGEVYRVVATAR